MRLTNLGHAFWLLEAGGLRVAMDPVLGTHHTGGLFELIPRRTVDAGALRPDFVLVSHAHFDHFDVDSLDALARRDADAVIVTPDALVAEVCRILGFRRVNVMPPGTRLDLDGGLSLVLTPSQAPDVEWGVLAADRSGVAWNLVDTLFSGPADVRRVRDLACPGRKVDVALAPLQPMREVALATADFVGFDVRHYRHLLACAAAIEARTVVPSAAGDAHAAPFEAMNRWVYPVSAERAGLDLKGFSPNVEVVWPGLGDVVEIDEGAIDVRAGEADDGARGGSEGGSTGEAGDGARGGSEGGSTGEVGDGARGEREGGSVAGAQDVEAGKRARLRVSAKRLLTRWPGADPRFFKPMEPVPLVDPNLREVPVSELRERSVRWVREVLAPAVGRLFAREAAFARLRFVIEVVLPGDRVAFTIGAEGRAREGFDSEYDVLNAIAGSMLVDVVEGRRAWYEPLLAGALRSAVRGALISEGRVEGIPLGPMLVYEAIGYRESTERAAIGRARRLLSER